jgi:hypothetical protein
MDFTACVPAIAWLAVLRYRGKTSAAAFITAATGLLTLQFGASIEIFATATLFGFVALVLVYLLQSNDRYRLRQLCIGFGCSYVLCLIIVSPYLYYMVKESSNVPSLIQPANIYVADVMNYVIPTRITAINGAWAASIAKRFTGNDAENGAYLGLPLLMVVAAYSASWWRNPWGQVLMSMFVILVLCSFGPYLHFEGHSLCPMPWWLAQKLPLLRQALPVRFSLYTSLAVGIMTALWLASLTKEQSMTGYMLALLAMLALMPNIRGLRSYWFTDLNDLQSPVFFSQGMYKQVLKPGDNIIVLPYLGFSTLWQASSGMYFRMAGGYITAYIPPSFARWPVVQMLYSDKPAPGAREELKAFCQEKDVRAVILTGPSRAASEWSSVLQTTGWQRTERGDVIVYIIPQRTIRDQHNYQHSPDLGAAQARPQVNTTYLSSIAGDTHTWWMTSFIDIISAVEQRGPG